MLKINHWKHFKLICKEYKSYFLGGTYILLLIAILLGAHHQNNQHQEQKQLNKEYVIYNQDLSENKAKLKAYSIDFYRAKFVYEKAINQTNPISKSKLTQLTKTMGTYISNKSEIKNVINRDRNQLHKIAPQLNINQNQKSILH